MSVMDFIEELLVLKKFFQELIREGRMLQQRRMYRLHHQT